MGTFEYDKVSGKLTLSGKVTWPNTAEVVGHLFKVALVSAEKMNGDDGVMAVAQVLGSIMQVRHEELAPDTKRLRGVLYAPDRGLGHPWISSTSFVTRYGSALPFPTVGADGVVSDIQGEQRSFSVHVPALYRFVDGVRNLLRKTKVDVIVRPEDLYIKSAVNKDEHSVLMLAISQYVAKVHLELGTSASEYALSGMNVQRVSTALPTGYIASTSPDRVKAFEEYISAYETAVETSENELNYKATFVRTRREVYICGSD